MSLKALSWAFDIEAIPSSNKLVLLALANYASETGKSYPSVETVCRITCQQDATVRRALENLTALNIISDTGSRVGSTQQVKVYQLPEHCCERPPKTQVFKKAKTIQRPPKDPLKTPERPPKTGGITGNGNQELEKDSLFQEPEKPSCPTRKFSDGWCAAFFKKCGAKYNFTSRDGKATSELVKLDNPEALLEIVEKAWQQNDERKFWSCVNKSATVWDFLSSLAKIRMELARAKAFQNTTHDRNKNY